MLYKDLLNFICFIVVIKEEEIMKRVFISYSWIPSTNKDRVKVLADKLIKDGIDVVIDIYNLQPGNDRFYFMERMVSDPSIDKVLIICNDAYSKKADQRSGGVGIESMIITPEVYGSVMQTKFIPIVFETDKEGNAYLPIYLKSKYYFDLSNSQNFEQQYRSLLTYIKTGTLIYNDNSKPNKTAKILKKDFNIGSLELPYLPIISSWNKGVNEYRYGDVYINKVKQPYTPPSDFINYFYNLPEEKQRIINENSYEPKVRLENYRVVNKSGSMPSEIVLDLTEIRYSDFLKTNCILDEKIPASTLTFREKYFEKDGSLVKNYLSNICGVGIFIITADQKIIATKTSNYVNVNPNVFAFSASGTMDWNDNIHPFNEVARECYEEIGYKVDIENLYLFSIGMDYQLGYYEFCFYERSVYSAADIIKNASMARDYGFEVGDIIVLDFDLSIIDHIKNNHWDVVSEAALLTLLTKEFKKSKVEEYLCPTKDNKDFRQRMLNTWKLRSQREGRLAVLSNRFPYKEINQISQNYINAITDFIDSFDLDSKNVLEIGCGIGLITKVLASKAYAVTSVDLSIDMINRAKSYLEKQMVTNVNFVNAFFQDFQSSEKYDMIVCSLVLTHNLGENMRKDFIEKMKGLSDTLYLFEPTNSSAQSSPESHPVSINTYLSYFPEYTVEKSCKYYLHLDEIVFIKLKKSLEV